MQGLRISRERFKVVHQEISEGSEPALRFYLLVTLSTLIAAFGLISNSTAVVIGAMLVAPLMTPIFGISLALVRGEPGLLGRAIRAEAVGVAAAVSMSFVLGLFLGDFEPTPEMLSRTRPILYDLIVAVLAGFAGAYALVDEKISPALPGVAIATAIVPPLANSGLCLALGEVSAGLGSFLLFVANMLSILVVASITFALSGMAKRFGAKAQHIDYARRFGLPTVAFVLIAVFLGHSLVKISHERRTTKAIRATLLSETSRIPSTVLEKVQHYLEEDRIHVMANVSTPSILTPTQVSKIQGKLTQKIGIPTELIVHCVLSSNVSALGSVRNTIEQKLDGTFAKTSGTDILKDIATAEQLIREHFAMDNALDLTRVEYLPFGDRNVMLAHIVGVRPLAAEEVARLEADIRTATGDPTIELAVSSLDKTMSTKYGPFRYGWVMGKQGTRENRDRVLKIRSELEAFFSREASFDLISINQTRLDDKFHFLLEIVGPAIYPRPAVEALQEELIRKFGESIALYAWSRVERVHGPEGPLSMKAVSLYFSDRQKENLPEEMPFILEAISR
jgi:uncharacterized hydrophobic protein (TIGR00271 family)